MSRVFICFSVLFILSIAVQFGDCENVTTNPKCEGNITSDFETHLSLIESGLKKLVQLGNPIFGPKNDSQSKGFWEMLQKVRNKFPKLIAPGTYWCGDGDLANGNETKLGFFKKTDACCRAHDNCHSDLLAGQKEGNIINNGVFTRSSCTCDNAFYDCLKDANNPFAFDIGKVYFNVLGQQCYKCICPMEDCNLKDGSECKGHCERYEWIDSRKY